MVHYDRMARRGILVVLAGLACLVLAHPGVQARPRVAGVTWGADYPLLAQPTPTGGPARPSRASELNLALAMAPANPARLIAGYDRNDSVGLRAAAAGSTDGGRTWAGQVFTQPWGPQAMTPL